MQQKISLKLSPTQANDDVAIKKLIAQSSNKKESSITGFHLLKKSIDARAKTIWVNLTVNAFIDEPFFERKIQSFNFLDVTNAAKKVVVIPTDSIFTE